METISLDKVTLFSTCMSIPNSNCEASPPFEDIVRIVLRRSHEGLLHSSTFFTVFK